MERNPTKSRIEAVDRALVLLILLGRKETVSVTDASLALRVAPSTAHRLLSTLLDRGFAIQDRHRRYAAGPALLEPGRTRGAQAVAALARPYLERLFDATQETCHLLVREGALVRFVDGVESSQALRVGLRTGRHMTALRTSGGKAMLAELSAPDLPALLRTPSAGFSEEEKEAARASLAQVREQRFGLNRDESEPGVTALGASIGIVDGHHVALSVAVPTTRVTAARTGELSQLLLGVCEQAREDLSSDEPTLTDR